MHENAEHQTACWVLRNVSRPLAISKRKSEDEKKRTSILRTRCSVPSWRQRKRLRAWPKEVREVTHAEKSEYWKTCNPSTVSIYPEGWAPPQSRWDLGRREIGSVPQSSVSWKERPTGILRHFIAERWWKISRASTRMTFLPGLINT